MVATKYQEVERTLRAAPKRWVVTGVAGFIGSHLLETLLTMGQHVIGIDNFVTGSKKNLEDVERQVGPDLWKKFVFLEGDINDPELCKKACAGASVVLHQAALGSVPRSIAQPLQTNKANVDGFLTVSFAAKEAGILRFVYASSSSIYGDEATLPKVESRVGAPLSPYAASKRADELYAGSFSNVYAMEFVGLRYFNVFGPRQDPEGPYAAVIPKWIQLLIDNKQCTVYGDGKTSRDFCYVANAVQANILAACAESKEATNRAYNVACGEQTSLEELYTLLEKEINHGLKRTSSSYLEKAPFRAGDVRHSLADITLAKDLLGYNPTHAIKEGLKETVSWYLSRTQS